MSRSRWFQYDQGPYRVGTKYVKNADHRKKPKRDESWLIEQGNRRRQDRGGRCGNGCQPSSKKSYQKNANKRLRQHTRAMLHHELWENMPVGPQKSKWIFRNSWDWS